MKKRIWIFTAVLLCAAGLTALLTQPWGYHRILEVNWSWDLPAGYTELYGYSEPGFHGDGLRYHVLQYRRTGAETLDKIFFGAEPGTMGAEVTGKVNGWLAEIGVPEEWYPDYEGCICILSRQEDGSELALFWDGADRILFAAESFY
ncbi:MAG: hypothetical protein IJ480_00155 [Clostridia bacterium]|nr:hypothetical protein [Clostridia bacterium]